MSKQKAEHDEIVQVLKEERAIAARAVVRRMSVMSNTRKEIREAALAQGWVLPREFAEHLCGGDINAFSRMFDTGLVPQGDAVLSFSKCPCWFPATVNTFLLKMSRKLIDTTGRPKPVL